MKKVLISFAVLAVSAAAIIAVNANNRMDEQFEANVEALAESENGGACTGPKETDHWLGRIYCHSTNANPCSDNYGCNS